MGEDLLQETYIRVIKSLEYYDPASPLTPTMMTIVKGVCASEADRKANKMKTVSMSNIDGSEESDDVDWLVADAMVVPAWMAENSPGYEEGPLPIRKARNDVRRRASRKEPKVAKPRPLRLPKEERDRRETVRQEWAAVEIQAAE